MMMYTISAMYTVDRNVCVATFQHQETKIHGIHRTPGKSSYQLSHLGIEPGLNLEGRHAPIHSTSAHNYKLLEQFPIHLFTLLMLIFIFKMIHLGNESLHVVSCVGGLCWVMM